MAGVEVQILRSSDVVHGGVTYQIRVFRKAGDDHLQVAAFRDGAPVIITYPDGFRASLTYTINPDMASDVSRAMGSDAVEMLIATAAVDLQRLI